MAGTILNHPSRRLVTGTASNPIQQWFFEQNHLTTPLEPSCLLLEMHTTPAVGAGSAALIGHHDALRLRFVNIRLGNF